MEREPETFSTCFVTTKARGISEYLMKNVSDFLVAQDY